MAIIEIMRGQFVANVLGNGAAVTNYGSFVSSNAAQEVQCDQAAAAWRFVFATDAGRYKFSPNDNAIVLSLWCCLPYHYVFSRPGASIAMAVGNDTGWGYAGRFGPNEGRVAVPVANSEIALGIYNPYSAVGVGTFVCYGAEIVNMWVSMIGVSALLNGQRFYPVVCAKVLHNLVLSA